MSRCSEESVIESGLSLNIKEVGKGQFTKSDESVIAFQLYWLIVCEINIQFYESNAQIQSNLWQTVSELTFKRF